METAYKSLLNCIISDITHPQDPQSLGFNHLLLPSPKMSPEEFEMQTKVNDLSTFDISV